jgi:16S rRNA (adenine1518-N6/adenine1519-N6)-dimethyltransferase
MKPKKSLGQNFLRDKNVLEKIIHASDLKPVDFVIEIGPGEGALSVELKKRAGKLIMIEKDEALAEKMARNFQFPISNFQKISNDLNYKFKNNSGIISGDILEINLPELIKQNDFKNYKVVANIPYYITSPIIQLFLETKFPPREMILMVQREVAERICASPSGITTENNESQNNSKKNNLKTNEIKQSIPRGKPGQMSILAVSVQYYAQPELLFYVDKKSFYPMPEVDSAVIKITPFNFQPATSPLTPLLIKERRNKEFFQIVHAGFSSKRKMLLNNLSNSLHLDKKTVEEKLKKVGISPKARAQELSVEDWKKLANLLKC